MLKQKIYKLNKEFDRIPEPRRFILFFLIAIPGIIATGIPSYLSWTPWIQTGGVAYMIALIMIRRAYFAGSLKSSEE